MNLFRISCIFCFVKLCGSQTLKFIIIFRTRDFMHVGNRARKAADVYVTNNNKIRF